MNLEKAATIVAFSRHQGRSVQQQRTGRRVSCQTSFIADLCKSVGCDSRE